MVIKQQITEEEIKEQCKCRQSHKHEGTWSCTFQGADQFGDTVGPWICACEIKPKKEFPSVLFARLTAPPSQSHSLHVERHYDPSFMAMMEILDEVLGQVTVQTWPSGR